MSKKRYSGLDKWRLGKQLNDYKEHKKKKREGIYPVSEQIKNKPKKKYKCKKLKGEHQWKLEEDDKKYEFLRNVLNVYRCVGCGAYHTQSKFDYVCEDCGSESLWLYAIIKGVDKRKCRKCGSLSIKEIKNKLLV